MNFNFGNKFPNIKTYAIIGVILTSIIAFLSNCTGIKQELIWDLFDEIQREINPKTPINDFIIKDPEKLQRRIHRDVNKAIRDYEKLTGDTPSVKIVPPRYIEEPMNDETCYSKECRALGPPMRLCSPWWDGCPKEP